MKFVGNNSLLHGHAFFGCRLHHRNRDKGKLCGDVCESVLTNDKYENNSKIVAWGYDGSAPDLLSVGMLSVTLGRFLKEDSYNWHVISRYYSADGSFPISNSRYELEFRPEVLRLYRLFTKQIVSKLPDNWEITTAEIMAWIRDHKRLPKCIRNNQNQRKNHGKEKAERKGSIAK